ncbi:BMP family lipoprotein [Gleimia hominis]|uniref:BMP family lipoprotein n=1 Tax=Gleimia hominis TaxID=595468 RepID=UPI000C802DDE|nr:BMP family ABC transporter substrate-binding protein [Gleimia hominis]WIK64690.1 BMP family ABC transporter substrate-binding protein [Gleimia hominis]
MKKASKISAAIAATALLLTACGAAPESGDKGKSSSEGGDKVKACMISDSGGFDDKSFNQSGHEGLMKAKDELGVEVSAIESHSEADFEPNIDAAVSDKCSIIIGVGFLMVDQLEAKAKANPDIKFAIVDSQFKDAPENARALVFNTAEAAYLAGYAAAGMTQTGKVATFLGMKIPTTAIFADGFADGIKHYNEENGSAVQLLGWDKEKQNGAATGNFEDVPKGKETAKQFLDQGADIIMPVAGPVGSGALAAVKDASDKNASIVWVDADGYRTQPESKDIILTSVVKEIGNSVFDTIKSVKEGKFDSKPYIGDLKNGGVSMAPFHDFDSKVPAELKEKLKKLQEQITSGEIKVETQNQP